MAADPFLTDMRYKMLTEMDKTESTRSSIKVTVPNWVQPSVEGFINSLKRTAHGSVETPAWNRMPMQCGPLWSVIPIPGSDGRLHKKTWTFTTMQAVNEVAKLHLVSTLRPDGTSRVGYGPVLLKSGGKIFSLVPPMTFCSYAKQMGSSWCHVVDVRCPVVSIPNSKTDTELQFSETHDTDVSFASSSVKTWPLLPPYDDYAKYLKKTLPEFVLGARDYYKEKDNAPQVSKKTKKLMKKWASLQLPAPRVSAHPYYMSPRLDKKMCGTIEPDCLRVKREQKELDRKRKRDEQERAKAERARERGYKMSQKEGPSRRFK